MDMFRCAAGLAPPRVVFGFCPSGDTRKELKSQVEVEELIGANFPAARDFPSCLGTGKVL